MIVKYNTTKNKTPQAVIDMNCYLIVNTALLFSATVFCRIPSSP